MATGSGASAGQRTWTGQWVARTLGVRLRTTGSPYDLQLEDLVGLALRRNPRRAHLLVSTVLGKHLPADPREVRDAGLLLGRRVRELLEQVPGGSAVAGVSVLGYAETATALGHLVAEALAAPYLHSTRRQVPGASELARFEEAHSHATTHLLLPDRRGQLDGDPLVLVDDELSTGATALATIEALHALRPRRGYVVAALVDLRDDRARQRCADVASRLGTSIEVASLVEGRVELPEDLLESAAALVSRTAAPGGPRAAVPAARGVVRRGALARVDLGWPRDLPPGGRHGVSVEHLHRLEQDLPAMAQRLADALGAVPGQRVHVLGTEELLHAPVRLGAAVADLLPATEVVVSSTTRSPALVLDEEGYALRHGLCFPAPDATDGPDRFVYNVAGPGGEPLADVVVLLLDEAADTAALHRPGGLVDQLRDLCRRLLLVVLPEPAPTPPEPLRGPAFGSYEPAEVGWLLTDLSDVVLEAPLEEREEAVQSGRAHYAESLPQEYQPTADYRRLYAAALEAGAARVATAVGVVTELLLAERDAPPVIASLARAGTPVGVLVRRWARQRHGLELPHYALSIVRGRGIDRLALRYLARHHDPSHVAFLDGWTGKGAIARELAGALEEVEQDEGVVFPRGLAVLADPGRCTSTYGTREDFLIPSACLNSTVSGLVSRTVLNRRLLGRGDYHGAKFYAGLASSDMSSDFVDAVSELFPDVAPEVSAQLAGVRAADRTPTWTGWRAVEQVAAAYDVGDVNLVKPGVGETTRVLLRRVPWRVLVRPDRVGSADLAHLLLLAEQRGVPVEEVPGLPYSCMGVVRPREGR